MASNRTVAVVGAGPMGWKIAHLSARGGYRTILEDILPGSLRKAQAEIKTSLDDAVRLGKLSTAEAHEAHHRLEYSSTVDGAAREADFVIEAVPDELESKIEIFTLLDKVCRPHTILASTTLSLSIDDIAAMTYRAQRCIGLRLPVDNDSGRLEIVRGIATDNETLAAAVELGRSMRNDIVILNDLACRNACSG